MQVFYKNKMLKAFLSTLSNNNSVGFVPTMGALHYGHLSLIEKARTENEIVVVSIFVNPTQFDNEEDLLKYPKNLNEDLKLLENANCDVVYAPDANEIYEHHIEATSFNFDGLENEMEGKHRKGHFDGVGTIVKRLFEIVKPDKAYFGEKDFQQLQIVRKLVEKYNIPVSIQGCAIFREKDGLAMSSRNVRLTKRQRKEAPFIYKILQKCKEKFQTETVMEVIAWVQKQFNDNPILELEYFEIADETTLKSVKNKNDKTQYRAFLAVFAGDIRLIDNMAL